MKNQDDWIFISAFPNLLLRNPFETKYAAIVPYDDKRVKLLMKKNISIAEILKSFVDTRLKKIKPSILIFNIKAHSNIDEKLTGIVTFRNIIALSVILEGWVPLVHSKHFNVSTTLFSDYYDLFPVAGYGDKSYSIESPALCNYVSGAKVKYQSNYLLPDTNYFSFFVDNKLFNTLISLWENYFIDGNNLHSYSSLFRSLQLVFSACKMPTDNLLYWFSVKRNLELIK